jgi:hypothetical protein
VLARTVGLRAAVVLGLCGIAIAQPLLDLFGRNPQFFIAGNYTDRQIVVFALLIALVPPLVGVAALTLASFVDQRLGTAVFALVVALLGGAIAFAVLRAVGVDRDLLVLGLGVAAAVGVAVLVLRARAARLFASYLAVANLLFVGLFLFASPTAELLAAGPDGDVGRVDVPRPGGPVVVIVLDELPAITLMRADGSLNSERFPGFAELARVSTWYRNASSPYANTHFAVPSILTGRLGQKGDLPTYGDRPRNLFTLLGGTVPVSRYEIISDMCPPAICAPPPRQPLRQAIEDATVVYGHRVLPEDLRESLPDISQSWGSYASDDGAGADERIDIDSTAGDAGSNPAEWSGDTDAERAYSKWRHLDDAEKTARRQAAILQEHVAQITASPALHFIHVALPHGPWMLNRSGYRSTLVPDLPKSPARPSEEFAVRQQYQLHAMQVGAADALVAELLEHLRSTGAWDETLLVVLGDHGTSFSLPDIWRKITDANRDEVLRPALFIKAPGQAEGEIRDDPAQTIDIVPSIADLLDARTDWEFHGHSLYDGSSSHTVPKVSTDVDTAVAIAARRAEWFPNGDGWVGLAAVGDDGDLVGSEVTDHDVGAPSDLRLRLAQRHVLADLPWGDGRMPYVLSGHISGDGGRRPPELLVAVNGRLAGVAGGYARDGDAWEFSAYVADFYRPGANEVTLYEVERAGGDAHLHPLGS